MDQPTLMGLQTFENSLDRYGADLSAWPEDVRGGAKALLDASADARAALCEMGEIEALIRDDRRAGASIETIAARAMRHAQARPVRPAVRWTGWAAAVAAALVLGLLVGGTGLDHEEGPDHVLAVALDQMGANDVD